MTEQDGPRAPAELYQELVIAMTRAIEEPTEDNDRLADMVVEKVRVAEFKAALEAGKYDDVPAELRETFLRTANRYIADSTEQNTQDVGVLRERIMLSQEFVQLLAEAGIRNVPLDLLDAAVTLQRQAIDDPSERKTAMANVLWTLVERAIDWEGERDDEIYRRTFMSKTNWKSTARQLSRRGKTRRKLLRYPTREQLRLQERILSQKGRRKRSLESEDQSYNE
jgi:hypothetical protein